MKWRLLVLGVTAALLVGCGGAPPAGVERRPGASTGEVVLSTVQQREGGIEVQRARTADQPDALRLAGRIAFAGDRTWRVGIRTNGVITAVLAGVGDHVRKGQVLARYHADEVRDARAEYRQARAALQSVESAQALAERNRDRAERLLELKAASVMQVEQARQDAVAAQAATSRAQIEVTRLKDQLEHGLHVPVESAPDDPHADEVPILAPAAGYILERNVTLGRAVDTDDDTFVIGDLAEVWMLASVRQDRLGELRPDMPARVTVNGLEQATFDGRITNIGQELDSTTRMMAVRITLKNPDNVLRAGMLGTATIPVGRGRSVVVVPSDALQQINGEDVVFVQQAPGRFVVRTVDAGATSSGETPILDGLKPGEAVVVGGSFVLKSQLLRASLGE